MSPRRAALAALAPVPYTGWALARKQETICSVLRRNRALFLTGMVVFIVHVLRGSTKRS